MSDGGKGDKRRRTEVSDEVVTQNWETIFGKKDKEILIDSVSVIETDETIINSPQLLVETPN